MNFGRQLIAFTGLVLCGTGLIPEGDALAFGQQWRPTAPGFSAAQPRPYSRVANMPRFRPQMAAATPHQRLVQGPAPRMPGAYPAWPSYPVPTDAYGYPPQPYPAPMMAAMPPWGPQPFGYEVQPWAHQVPMFTRQFAWRPAGQPWLAANANPYPAPQYAAPAYPQTMAPPSAGFRPLAQSSRMPASHVGWPTTSQVPAFAAGRQHDHWGPGYTAARQGPVFAGAYGTWAPGSAGLAGYGQAAAMAWYDWRPAPLASAGTWRAAPATAFRPAAYGRSVRRDDRLAARAQGGDITRERLPGWVTTYQDADYAAACSWCGGS